MANPTIPETEENLLKEFECYKLFVPDLERNLSKAHEKLTELRTSYTNLADRYVAVRNKLKDTETRQEQTIHQLKADLDFARQQLMKVQNENQILNKQIMVVEENLQKAKQMRKGAFNPASFVNHYISNNYVLIKQIEKFLELIPLGATIEKIMKELDEDECGE